jgi:hypothetical protein
MKRFYLQRNEDETGVSGTGRVAEGVVFSRTGMAVMHWLTHYESIGVYPSIEELIAIHGHAGRTVVVFEEEGNC